MSVAGTRWAATRLRNIWNSSRDKGSIDNWFCKWAYFMTVTTLFCTGQNILIDGLEAGNVHFVWPEK